MDKIGELGNDVNTFISDSIETTKNSVMAATVEPFRKSVEELLYKIDDTWSEAKIKEFLDKEIDELIEDIDDTGSIFEEIIVANEGSSSSSQTQRIDNFSEFKKSKVNLAIKTNIPDRQIQFTNDKIKSEFNKSKFPLAIKTSVPTSYDDAYNRLFAIENVSKKIEQKNKALKKTEKKVEKAESKGTVKTTPQQQQKLKHKQAQTANNVAKASRGINNTLGRLLSVVKTKGEKAESMIKNARKRR
jgi:hypothetical protein